MMSVGPSLPRICMKPPFVAVTFGFRGFTEDTKKGSQGAQEDLKPSWVDFTSGLVAKVSFAGGRSGNILKERDTVLAFAEMYQRGSLQLSVVDNLCQAAKVHDLIAECRFGSSFPSYQRDYFNFTFKDRIWYMTQTWETPRYGPPGFPRQPYQAVNIKLPNDGFVYHPQYSSKKPGVEDIDINEDHPDVKSFLHRFSSAVEKIPDFNPTLSVNFRVHEDRLELYFDDVENARLLTVKFEPGRHLLLRSVQNKPKSLKEWKRIFASESPKIE